MAASYKWLYNRLGKLKKDGTSQVQLRVINQRKQYLLNTDIYITPSQWSEKNGGTIIKHRKAPELNKTMQVLFTTVIDYEVECRNAATPFVPADALTQDSELSFIEWMFKQADNNQDITHSSYKNHVGAIRHFKAFGKIHTFADFTLEKLEAFDRYLQSKIGDNTRISRHKIIRYYTKRACNKNLLKRNPYEHFTIPKEKYQARKFLSWDMLNAIIDKEMPNERLSVVKDMFLFSCFTGLSYSDVQKLNTADFYEYNNTTFIITDRSKTNEESSIPLLPQANDIVRKYISPDNTQLLPIPTNQRMNGYLKEIQAICNIPINLTYHVARHTFATTVTLENGVPIETVSRMLGHKSLKTTQVYAKLTRKKLADDMAGLVKKMGGE